MFFDGLLVGNMYRSKVKYVKTLSLINVILTQVHSLLLSIYLRNTPVRSLSELKEEFYVRK